MTGLLSAASGDGVYKMDFGKLLEYHINKKADITVVCRDMEEDINVERFDWKEKEDVWDKVQEELEELKVELAKGDKENSTQELGDFIFSVINAARLYKLNPDNALEKTNQKFIRRFNYVEDHSLKQGKNLKDMSLEEMDKLWDEAKLQEKKDDK